MTKNKKEKCCVGCGSAASRSIDGWPKTAGATKCHRIDSTVRSQRGISPTTFKTFSNACLNFIRVKILWENIKSH